jgi:hypothetical protein
MSDQTEIKEIARFQAIDAQGKTYTLIAYQTFIISETHSGQSRVPTTKSLRTADGAQVNRIDENTFEIVTLRRRLKRA